MAELSYSDTATVNLGGSGTAGDPITANLIPLGTACALVDDAPALAKLKDAIDTNTFPVATSWNGADDIFTITMNEGPPLQTTITGFPVNGSYMPNAAGVINIPLTNGNFLVINGTVSPPDVDFASTTVTVGANGETTIDYLDSDGNVITSSVLAADMDDYLTGLSIAADGCTLEGTMDGGATYSVSLCDLVSSVSGVDNADGSATYTHTDGTGNVTASWTVSTPQPFVDESGASYPYDPTTPIKIARNPVVDRFCRDGVDVTRFCDGSEKISWSDNITRQISFNPTIGTIDSTVAVGTVIAAFEFTLDPGECPRQVTQHSYHSLTGQGVPSTRHVTVRARSSIGGGAMTNFATGGEDRLWGNGSTQGEIVYRGTKPSQTVAAGGQVIRIEFAVERNTLTAADGFYSMGRAALILSYNQEMCK